MASKSPSFASNWVIYASLKHAQKHNLFRGQKVLLKSLSAGLNTISAPGSSFGRQLRLLQVLRKSRQSADGLCKRLKISRRTLFRDLATIRRAGIAVESDGQYFGLSPKQLRSALGGAL
jgi:biotin operon repressor